MSNLSRNIFFTFITQFPTQFLGIIAGIFITRMLGPDGRGAYAIFLADVDLCVTIFGFSIGNAIIYYFASGKIYKSKIYGISLVIIFFATILFVIVTLIVLYIGFGAYFFPKDHITFLMIIWFVAATFITLLSNVFNGIFQGYREFNVVNKVAISNSVFNILIFGAVFIYHKITHSVISVEHVLILTLVALFMNMGLWYYNLNKYHKRLKPVLKVSFKEEILPLLKFLGIGHLSNIINFLNYRFSLWIIAIYLSAAEVGYFGLASGIAGMLNLIATPISSVLMPYLSKEVGKKRRKIFAQYSRLNFTIILFAGTIGFFIAPVVIPFVYGKEFIPAILIFQISLVGTLFTAQNKIMGIFNISDNMQKINLYATIIGLFLTVITSFILIPNYGLIGATICNLITYLCMFIFLYINFTLRDNSIFSNIFIVNKSDKKSIQAIYERKRRSN